MVVLPEVLRLDVPELGVDYVVVARVVPLDFEDARDRLGDRNDDSADLTQGGFASERSLRKQVVERFDELREGHLLVPVARLKAIDLDTRPKLAVDLAFLVGEHRLAVRIVK